MSEEKTSKYSVLTKFRDKESQEIHLPGSEIDITDERAEEITTKLGAGFIIKKAEEINEEPPLIEGDSSENDEELQVVNFDEMKVKELNDYAVENGIEIPEDVKLKPDVIAFLKEATKPTSEEE